MCVCVQKHIESAGTHGKRQGTISHKTQQNNHFCDGRVKEDVQVMLAARMLTLVHVVLDFELQLPRVRLHPVHMVLQVLLVLFVSVLELDELLHGGGKKIVVQGCQLLFLFAFMLI